MRAVESQRRRGVASGGRMHEGERGEWLGRASQRRSRRGEPGPRQVEGEKWPGEKKGRGGWRLGRAGQEAKGAGWARKERREKRAGPRRIRVEPKGKREGPKSKKEKFKLEFEFQKSRKFETQIQA